MHSAVMFMSKWVSMNKSRFDSSRDILRWLLNADFFSLFFGKKRLLVNA